MENKEFQKVYIKNSTCYYYYSNDIIKFEDFDFDNLIDEKLKKNFDNFDIMLLRTRFDFMMEIDI